MNVHKTIAPAEVSVFPPDTIISSPWSFKASPFKRAPQTDKFIRRIHINTMGLEVLPLELFLGIADAELKNVADMCGALVVHHRWGIVESTEEIAAPEPILPNGHILVAEVENIVESPLLADPILQKALTNTISKYRISKEQSNTPRLYDMRYDQFIEGQPFGQSKQDSQIYLVDIEPRFGLW